MRDVGEKDSMKKPAFLFDGEREREREREGEGGERKSLSLSSCLMFFYPASGVCACVDLPKRTHALSNLTVLFRHCQSVQ